MKSRGLTLLEVMIALAMLAVLASIALPSFGSATERARLKSAAETLAADLADARFEAAQRGQAIHIEYGSGAEWCWSVALAPGCPCGGPQSCQLKTVRAKDHAGIELLQSGAARLDPSGQAAGGSALFQSSRGDRLRVDLSPLGRASVCVAAGNLPGYPAC